MQSSFDTSLLLMFGETCRFFRNNKFLLFALISYIFDVSTTIIAGFHSVKLFIPNFIDQMLDIKIN